MGFNIGLEATRRCNFTCRHCFVDAGLPLDGEMDTEEMKAVIRGLAACGTDSIGWSGGEPLIRRDLEELTLYGAQRGLEFGLATNGFLATPQRLAALQVCGLRVVQVSLDGATPERAERYRRGPKDSFQRAIRAVQESLSLGLTTYFCTLLSPETVAEIDEMIDFARGYGVDGIRYTMWAPVGRAQGGAYDEQAWSDPLVERFFQVAQKEQGKDFGVLIDCPTGPYPGMTEFRCQAGRDTAYITATGDVFPCTALMAHQYLVGNLRERPLSDLLYDGEMLKIQREMAGSLPGGSCSACALIQSCRGGCPGRTVYAFGNLRSGPHAGGAPACLLRLHDPDPEDG